MEAREMANGPIRNRGRTSHRAPREPASGPARTTNGVLVPVAAPVVPAPPTLVDPQVLAQRWRRLQLEALGVLEQSVTGQFEDPAHQRERRHAAECVLGFRRGGLPMPALMGALQNDARQERGVIRLRWANGGPVKVPLSRPSDQPADADEENP
jgi:hypothetical protein